MPLKCGKISLGPWRHARPSLATARLFFRAASASPPEADGESHPHSADRAGAPEAGNATAKAKAAQNRLSATKAWLTPTWMQLIEADGGPRRGIGYIFDSTLGYPGEGPFPPPPHRRDVRPGLRLWSTARPVRAPPAPNVIPARIPGDLGVPAKRAHGNNDTSLGRWLHSLRTHKARDSSKTGSSRRHDSSVSSRDVAPNLPHSPGV